MKKVAFEAILRERNTPAIAVDQEGIIFFVNEVFEQEYGWESSDLLGKVITVIMPPYMRDAHNLGFSRFLVTEQARILDKPLLLPVYCKDKTIRRAQHYIVSDKKNGKWRFAALVRPL